jgi:NADH dehydrogenase
VANHIKRQLKGESSPAFHYFNKGNLAVIGRNAGVADFGRIKFAGFMAWLTWVFVHLWYLVEFDNKLLVMFQWAWNYFTRNRGARLITGSDTLLLIEDKQVEQVSLNLSDSALYPLGQLIPRTSGRK